MNLDPKLAICAVASVIAHVAIARALDELPPRVDLTPRKIEVRVIEAPTPVPPPEPEKPPEPAPEPTPTAPAKPIEHQTVRPHAVPTAAVVKEPPPDHPAVTGDTTGDSPVFGISMESTSTVGRGPALPVGTTAKPAVGTGSAAPAPKGVAGPVADYEATKLPLPQGRCSGKYTDDARAAGIEGTVVLDLVVGADGRVSELKVVTGLGHGLDQAAIAALRDCRFTPGEQAGKPVAVRVRGFKIRFVIEAAP
ncbi:MAG: TonB family protein [Kofleriaceae bacterium]